MKNNTEYQKSITALVDIDYSKNKINRNSAC